jgi:hypothetical protein
MFNLHVQYRDLQGKYFSSWNSFELQLLNLTQRFVSKTFIVVKRFVVRFLQNYRLLIDIGVINKNGYTGAERIFGALSVELRNASKIWMCVGEMGSRMMERDDIIAALRYAAQVNHAEIYIIHGPRVDYKTQRIYDLAAAGMVQLYSLSSYPSEHFIYIKKIDGDVSLLEEAPHTEPIRGLDENGEKVEIHRGLIRPFYLIMHPNLLGFYRYKQALNRIQHANLSQSRPSNPADRGYPFVEALLAILFKYIAIINFLQPLVIFIDRLIYILFQEKPYVSLNENGNDLPLTKESFVGLLERVGNYPDLIDREKAARELANLWTRLMESTKLNTQDNLTAS